MTAPSSHPTWIASSDIAELAGASRSTVSNWRNRYDDFPQPVARALVALAAADGEGYRAAVGSVLESFEQRTDFLEDVPVADTVLVLQVLARQRAMLVDLPASPQLPKLATRLKPGCWF